MKLKDLFSICVVLSALTLGSMPLVADPTKTVTAAQNPVQSPEHNQPQTMSAAEILSLVHQINELQNNAILASTVKADVDALFALYSPDFEYVHEQYGGRYSRDVLYRNTLRAIEAGRYQEQQPRYRIEVVLPGLNAAAVRRYQQTGTPAHHLTLFEFANGKVRRIVEYW